MAQVTELGYLGLGVKDLAAWRRFAGDILGLEVVEEEGRTFLRWDYWHHRIELKQDGTDDLAYIGLRVAGAEEFGELEQTLAKAGVAHRVGSEAEAERRHVLELMTLTDPNGHPIEIFHGPHIQYSKPFHPGRRMHGRFHTGDGGLGHVFLNTEDTAKTLRFYQLLGFRGAFEYKVKRPDGSYLKPLFLHCNSRDHTFAFAKVSRRINHMMLDVDNLNDVGLLYDLVQAQGLRCAITPGRHSNDHDYSFYLVNPSGWMIEYGWGSRDATHQSEYYEEDLYGHVFAGVDMNMEALPAAAE